MTFISRPIRSSSSIPVAAMSAGSVGNAMQKGIEHPLVDGSDGHQVIAQAAAAGDHALQRLGHIGRADQICLDQQISQPHSRADNVLLETASIGAWRLAVPGTELSERPAGLRT